MHQQRRRWTGNAYRAAEIAFTQARRSLDQFEDELEVDVRTAFRDLARIKESIAIQGELIIDQQKNLRKARIEFEQGDAPNRDVVEAQQSLVTAMNSLIQEKVNYVIARLRLLRALGILFVDDNGMWIEP